MKPITPSRARAERPILDIETGISEATFEAATDLKSTDRAVREQILHRAYTIWESEGHPTDRKLANWLEAETFVMAPH